MIRYSHVTLENNQLDGIKLDAPIGKKYLTDLNRVIKVQWLDREIDVVIDMITGGFLPFELLEIRKKW